MGKGKSKGPRKPEPRSLVQKPIVPSAFSKSDTPTSVRPLPAHLFFDFGQLCPNQSLTFGEMEGKHKLALAMERIREAGKRTKDTAISDKAPIYNRTLGNPS